MPFSFALLVVATHHALPLLRLQSISLMPELPEGLAWAFTDYNIDQDNHGCGAVIGRGMDDWS